MEGYLSICNPEIGVLQPLKKTMTGAIWQKRTGAARKFITLNDKIKEKGGVLIELA